MIITKTPFRVSLFGGSTDYRSYYEKHNALLIGFCINKYSYLNVRYTPHILDHHTRVTYSKTEIVNDNSKIEHDGVRGVLDYLTIKGGVEINHFSDLPAQTGIGSSSSFIVGLLKALMYLQSGRRDIKDKKFFASTAIHIERELLKEAGGIQDQIWASYGGFNALLLEKNSRPACSLDRYGYKVRPMPLSDEFLQSFRDHSILLYTGRSRKSFEIAKAHDSKSCEPHKHEIKRIAHDAYRAFENEDLYVIGYLLNQSWLAKKSISPIITSDPVDDLYQDLYDNGMVGGKLLGSGGSGFIFGIFDKISDRNKMIDKYHKLNINYNFDMKGSKILNG
jgi:D-glycero-alpha-D-manno-heptose-7-phosphate kinase